MSKTYYEVKMSVVCSLGDRTHDFIVTPFFNGVMQSPVKFADFQITLERNANWRFPYRLVNSFGQQLWVEFDVLECIFSEITRYLKHEQEAVATAALDTYRVDVPDVE